MARFVKGQVGNPKGRPKGSSVIGFVEQCRKWSAEFGMAALEELARSNNEKIRLEAIKYLMDRAHGKATERQEIDMTGGLNVDTAIGQKIAANPEATKTISDLISSFSNDRT